MVDAAIAPPPVTAAQASLDTPRPLAAPLFFFGVLALLFALSDRLLRDPDTYWHIAVGQEIWRTGAFPWSDTLSHTFAGAPWIAKEWLSQIVLHAAHALGGWWGLATLTSVTIASSFALLLVWLQRRLQPTAALVFAGATFTLAAGQMLARPHLFSFPIVMLWTGAIVSAAERRRAPSWWLVPLMALWANLHASFPLGFVIAGLIGLEAVAAAAAGERLATTARWAAFGLASLVAIGATPYGFEPLLVSIRLFGSGEAMRYIAEWQPLGFGANAVLPLAAAAASLAVLAASPKRNLFRLLLVGFCAFMMVRHVRFSGLFAIVAAIVCAAPLARLLPAATPAATPPLIGTASRLGLAALVVACIALSAVMNPGPSPAMTPAGALAAARTMQVSGPVFNEYDFGGHLISEGVPTFIDGRSDQLFNAGFMNELNGTLAAVEPGPFLAFVGRYGVTWAIVRPGSSEDRHFRATSSWFRAYEDSVAVLHIRRSP